jgi:hypothetical protein
MADTERRVWSDDVLRAQWLPHSSYTPLCVSISTDLCAQTAQHVYRLRKDMSLGYWSFLWRRFLRIWPSLNFYVLVSTTMATWAFRGEYHYLATDLFSSCFINVSHARSAPSKPHRCDSV